MQATPRETSIPSSPENPASRTNAADGLLYVRIPAGAFQMGCAGGETRCKPDTKPPHEVQISREFHIGQTEVTRDAYARLTRAAVTGNLPVANVTWEEARQYCASAGGRLPTEAEWEYSSRGGAGGQFHGPVAEIAWHQTNSGGEPHPVATLNANSFGLHDTLGNVWEWTADIYGPAYYSASPLLDPTGPERGSQRVVRGGAYSTPAGYVSLSARFAFPPRTKDATIGFRCVLP